MSNIEAFVVKIEQDESQYWHSDFGKLIALYILDANENVIGTLSLGEMTAAEATSFFKLGSLAFLKGYLEQGVHVNPSSESLVYYPSDEFSPIVLADGSKTNTTWIYEYNGRNATLPFLLDSSKILSLNQASKIGLLLVDFRPIKKVSVWLGFDDNSRSAVLAEKVYTPAPAYDSAGPQLIVFDVAFDITPPAPPGPKLLWGLNQSEVNSRRLLFAQALPAALEGEFTRRVLVGETENASAEVDEILLERMHIPFPRGDVMDWESVKQISYVAPKCRKAGPDFYIDLWLGTQEDVDSPIRWHGPKRWKAGKKGVFFDKSGRFISLRARIPADMEFRLTGYDIEYKLVSKR